MQIAQQTISTAEALKEKIASKTARVGVVGLGYVGLPLAVEFANAGFSVTGIDVQQSKVDQLNRGESYIQDVPTDAAAAAGEGGKFTATTDFSVVARTGHDQHLRPDAAAQNQRSGHELHRVRLPRRSPSTSIPACW